jgi:hypothetical protein
MTILGLPREGRFDFRMKSWLENLAKKSVVAPPTKVIVNADITMVGGGTAITGGGEIIEMPLGDSGIIFVWCWFTVNLTSVAGTTGITLPISEVAAALPNAACFPFYNGVGTRLRFLRAQVNTGLATFTIAPISYDDVPNNYAFYTGSQSFNGNFCYKVA